MSRFPVRMNWLAVKAKHACIQTYRPSGAPKYKSLLATTAQPILLEGDHSIFEQFNEHRKNIFAIVSLLSTITNRLGRVIMKLNNSLTIGAGSPTQPSQESAYLLRILLARVSHHWQ
ncbi:hypothetical protein [Prochlorococcus sp. MIT 1303]|uniref:hypothetical protein n=1 Tax=Prochlorococcus sp. MIT 1303 TaxID=1723647 RepID=UPI0012E90AE0|nr:hypothetical protein [Prochlorococcus sp. MIT 1303]